MKPISEFPQKATPTLPELCRFVVYAQADPRLTSSAQRVLAVLMLGHFNLARQRAWPSLATLASETNLHRMAVSKAIRCLRDCGYVLVVPGSGRRSSSYGLGPRFSVSREAYSAYAAGLTKQTKGTVRAINRQHTQELVGQGGAA